MNSLNSDYEFIFEIDFDQLIYNSCNIPSEISLKDNIKRQLLIKNAITKAKLILDDVLGINHFTTFVNFTDSSNSKYKYKLIFHKCK